MSLTALVDIGSGNLHSAEKAFRRMAVETGAGEVIVTGRAGDLARADRIVLPGDGAFPACRDALDARPELLAALGEAVTRRAVPFLGICVGMQLMATRSHEHGLTRGFGWIAGEVVAITPDDAALKVPHMGWNEIVTDRPHPLLAGVATGDHVYFVHSWRLALADPADLIAHADHGGPVAAVVGHANMVGTQFHPEKSQRTGLRLIANFLTWTP